MGVFLFFTLLLIYCYSSSRICDAKLAEASRRSCDEGWFYYSHFDKCLPCIFFCERNEKICRRHGCTGPPPAPSNLEVVQLTNAAVTVEWNSAFEGNSDQEFYVQYKKCAEKWDVASEVPHEGIADPGLKKTVRYEVIGLESNVCYVFRVHSKSAVPGSHTSVFSNTASASTQGPLSAPSDLKVVQLTYAAVTVEWISASENNSDQKFYVQYKKCEEEWDVASEVPQGGIADPGLKKTVRYEVMDLESNVCYEFRVRSRSALPGTHTSVFSNTAMKPVTKTTATEVSRDDKNKDSRDDVAESTYGQYLVIAMEVFNAVTVGLIMIILLVAIAARRANDREHVIGRG